MPKHDRYMLIDGNAWIHRGYHAIPILNTKSGEQTNAVFGFTSILLKSIKDLKPTHIAATFDLSGPTFRHDKYKDYKATRVKADQALYDQIPRVKQVARALNIPVYEKQGFEADDLLGTLAKHLHEKHPEAEIIIATGDLDTLQLVNHQIKVYTLKQGITDVAVYDAKAVRDRYGLSPDQMVDYRALKGDPSDNIPGVKGIGEKGAIELIKEFKSIDNLYKAIAAGKTGNKIKPRVLELLKAQEEGARMSYDVSTIDCKVPVKIEVPKYELDAPHLRETVKLFQDLEFRSLLNKLPKPEVAGKPSEDGESVVEEKPKQIKNFKQDYELVDTEEKLKKMLKDLSAAEELSIDTETTSLSPVDADLVGIGLSAKAGKAYYVPANLVLSSKELEKLIAQKSVKKIGHNIKYDLQILQAAGVPFNPDFDTMIASYLLNAGTRQHGLDGLAFSELGYQMQPITDLIGKGKSQITMDQVDVEKVSWYCCEDVDMTLRLKELFEPELKKDKLDKVFYDIEMPLVTVLANVETNGILLDSKLLNKLSGEAEITIKDLEEKTYKQTGHKFNINSPKQLKEILFDKLKLEPIENRKNKSGLSTAAAELEKMKGQHPVIENLLEYREITKLQSTYLLTLPQLVSKKTGRLHTSYNQTIAATGRLSSIDPNLQNIPVRGEGMGSEVRKAFVAAKGYQLLSLDYSQIELRIVAHLAQDKRMMEIFKKGHDIHSETAMEIFGVPKDKVTKDMRRDAKTINFGILYGVSSFGLSSRVQEMTRADAKEYIAKYFAAYPQVEQFIEQVKLQVREEGFVRNALGRIRRFPEIKSSQFFIRAAAERAAINFPIQSLAADVIKVAMIDIFKEIEDKSDEIKMLLTVHDELVFEVAEDKVESWAKKLKPLMENAIKLSIPVNAEAKAGKNWAEMEELKI